MFLFDLGNNLLLTLHISGVIAVKFGDLAAIYLNKASCQVIHKASVMADKEQGTLPFQQKLLEPVNGFNIKMVGGLIQQQQIGVTDQRSGQQYPALIAAGETGDIHIRIQRHFTDNGFNPLVDIPAINQIQLRRTVPAGA